MKSEKMIRSILEQYEFNLNALRTHCQDEIEDIKSTEQWVNALKWVLDDKE